MARRWLLLLLPFLVGVATKAKADGDGTKGPWHQRQQGPSQGPIGGSKGTGKGSGGAKDEGAGGFRTILHYISHKKLQGAKAGLQKHGNAAVTVDKPGHWHSQAGQDRTIAWLFDGKHDGYFVDLAANDPILYSNTRTLERDYGWRGVCIDGNMAMLQKLVAQRTCTVVKGIVSRTSGAVVQFTNPEQSGTWEDAMGGILSNATDNSKVRPGYAAQKWRAVSETTVTLVDILDRVQSPSLVDYLSLDIEGAEYDAMAVFPFERYRFRFLTIERPNSALRALLRSRGYVYLIDHGCFGDQLWAHESEAEGAARKLGVAISRDDHDTCDGLALSHPSVDHPLQQLQKLPCQPKFGGKRTPVECCGKMSEEEMRTCVLGSAA